MPDPRPLDAASSSDPDLRDRQIEALLVEGLDRYFNGRYEDAVHVWTRVLFLDRSHPRARAYIDRARATLAEGHRRGDQMLDASQELLARGETAAARDLLRAAIAEGGDDARASALGERLERALRVRSWAPIGDGLEPDAVPTAIAPVARRDRRAGTIGIALALGGVVAVTLLTLAVMSGAVVLTSPVESVPAPIAHASTPPLSSDEVAVARARAFYAQGRLAEALQALDRVGPDGDGRVAADAMRVGIQRLLLATVPVASHDPPHDPSHEQEEPRR